MTARLLLVLGIGLSLLASTAFGGEMNPVETQRRLIETLPGAEPPPPVELPTGDTDRLSEANRALGLLVNPGALSTPHQGSDGLSHCIDCHVLGGGLQDDKCLKCHPEIKQRVDTQTGLHGHLDKRCYACHTEHGGRDTQLIDFKTDGFDHERETGLALTGRHVKIECKTCHGLRHTDTGRPTYLGLSPMCTTCHDHRHQDQFSKVTPRDPRFGPCADCHTTEAWQVRDFDHDHKTRFKLTGAHQRAACFTCHRNGRFHDNRPACDDCHANRHGEQFADRRARLTPGKDPCVECHDTVSWRRTRFDHDTTEFQRTGAHARVDCLECHRSGGFHGNRRACLDCHANRHGDQFARRLEQPASGRTTGDACLDCHTTASWRVAKFDHDQTDFKLTGAHQSVACKKCHDGTTFNEHEATCATCHRSRHGEQFARRVSQRPQGSTCLDCHTTTGWIPVTFDHGKEGYRVTGAFLDHVKAHQKQASCLACHRLAEFVHEQFECTTCHGDGHAGRLTTRCQSCHLLNTWQVDLERHEELDFKLAGRHRALACDACHASGITYTRLDPACGACHEDRHGGRFGSAKECTQCHSQEDWQADIGLARANRSEIFFDHRATNFPLEGAHATVECVACHITGDFAGNDGRCYTCHWQRSRDDVWSLQIGSECGECHTPRGWAPARWKHTQPPANYRLEGAHTQVDCLACHPAYHAQGTATECIACHQKDFR